MAKPNRGGQRPQHPAAEPSKDDELDLESEAPTAEPQPIEQPSEPAPVEPAVAAAPQHPAAEPSKEEPRPRVPRADGKAWVRARARQQQGFWRAQLFWSREWTTRLLDRATADRILAEPRIEASEVDGPGEGDAIDPEPASPVTTVVKRPDLDREPLEEPLSHRVPAG